MALGSGVVCASVSVLLLCLTQTIVLLHIAIIPAVAPGLVLPPVLPDDVDKVRPFALLDTGSLYRQLMSAARVRSGSQDQYKAESPTTAPPDDVVPEITDGESLPSQRPLQDVAKTDGVVVTWSGSGSAWWADWQLPVFVVLFAVIGVLAVTSVVLLWLKNQMLSTRRKAIDAHTSPCGADGGRWIFHPVLPPPLEQCDAGVQPQVPEECPEPVRIKAKGLLERRGSSASLTIDLHGAATECLAPIVTPTRECTTEEYLLSAGNVLSRGQLRLCLRDVRALHQEFWDLPSNHPERATVAGSGPKNRYRSILPNEHSRVRLAVEGDDELAAYINANYLRGYDAEEKVYIATQGPLPHTISSFWLMVWTEQPSAIVMITKLWEKGRAKCEAYFPLSESEGPVEYGDIVVSVASETQREGYTIRELLIKRAEQSHSVLHFWYDTWPDHKTPLCARSLVAMATEVEAVRRSSTKGPVIVHCSAGIGRTGCFIAVSVGMKQLMEENNVDILGIVCQMRYDRGGMIQTAEQYEFVHRALCLFERSLPDQSGE